MNTLFYPPVSQEVFYRVKDSDMNMSYLTQILAAGNLVKKYRIAELSYQCLLGFG